MHGLHGHSRQTKEFGGQGPAPRSVPWERKGGVAYDTDLAPRLWSAEVTPVPEGKPRRASRGGHRPKETAPCCRQHLPLSHSPLPGHAPGAGAVGTGRPAGAWEQPRTGGAETLATRRAAPKFTNTSGRKRQRTKKASHQAPVLSPEVTSTGCDGSLHTPCCPRPYRC